MKKIRVRATFAGIEFSGTKYPNFPEIYVPKPALRKILNSGKVNVRENYNYTDDYAADAEKKPHDVTPQKALDDLNDLGIHLCTLEKNEIRYSPMRSRSYTITEKA
jgi:hypothetical protein